MREQTPCDVPGTSDHEWDVEQMRRDDEIDATYETADVLRERRAALQMRRAQARQRAIDAGHPSAQSLSTTEGAGGCTAAAVVGMHFAAPPAAGVEQCDLEASPPPGQLRTPNPKGQQL